MAARIPPRECCLWGRAAVGAVLALGELRCMETTPTTRSWQFLGDCVTMSRAGFTLSPCFRSSGGPWCSNITAYPSCVILRLPYVFFSALSRRFFIARLISRARVVSRRSASFFNLFRSAGGTYMDVLINLLGMGGAKCIIACHHLPILFHYTASILDSRYCVGYPCCPISNSPLVHRKSVMAVEPLGETTSKRSKLAARNWVRTL